VKRKSRFLRTKAQKKASAFGWGFLSISNRNAGFGAKKSNKMSFSASKEKNNDSLSWKAIRNVRQLMGRREEQ